MQLTMSIAKLRKTKEDLLKEKERRVSYLKKLLQRLPLQRFSFHSCSLRLPSCTINIAAGSVVAVLRVNLFTTHLEYPAPYSSSYACGEEYVESVDDTPMKYFPEVPSPPFLAYPRCRKRKTCLIYKKYIDPHRLFHVDSPLGRRRPRISCGSLMKI